MLQGFIQNHIKMEKQKQYQVIKLKRNINNLQYPIIIFNDGSEICVHVSILKQLFPEIYQGYDIIFENVKQRKLTKEEIINAYKNSPLKYDIKYIQKEINILKEQGIQKGFYKHLTLLSKSIYEFLKEWDLLNELKQ